MQMIISYDDDDVTTKNEHVEECCMNLCELSGCIKEKHEICLGVEMGLCFNFGFKAKQTCNCIKVVKQI